MSDAIARWFISELHSDGDPLGDLSALSTKGQFETFILALRKNGKVRIDDTTLIFLDVLME